jgi:ankyrin repeat protein
MSIKPKPIMKRKLAYFEDRGSDMKVFSLLLAVYNDRFEDAEVILKAEPAQLNSKDPYAGLTALHIAIFRQNSKIVQLLLAQEGVDVRIKDGFGRRPVDMLDYTANQDIFDMIMDVTYPDTMRALENETLDEGLADGSIASFKPKGP